MSDLTATRFNIYIKKRVSLLPCSEEIVLQAGVKIISTEKCGYTRKKNKPVQTAKLLSVAFISPF